MNVLQIITCLDFEAGTVGLLLVYALNIPPVLQRLLMWSTEVESHFTSVERVLEYCDLEPEAALETDVKPDKDWPNRGSVMFENVHFRYHETLPEILHGINAHVKPKEKVLLSSHLITLLINRCIFLSVCEVWAILSEAYLEPFQPSLWGFFVKLVPSLDVERSKLFLLLYLRRILPYNLHKIRKNPQMLSIM